MCHKIPRFIDKSAQAGVKRVFIGLENINPDSLVGTVANGVVMGLAGGVAIVLPYLVPFLIGLAILEAGASAYIAPLGPNHGGQAAIEKSIAAETGACGASDADDLGTAVLTVVDLGEEVQGWRLRAEASAADLDGSPTFYFSDSEEVTGTSTPLETTRWSPRNWNTAS